MELTAKQLDALTHAVQNAPWAWATPYRMSDAGARASSLLALRAWLELGGYLLQTAESPTVWARFDGASDLRSGENLAALEAMECPHECGPEVERLASMPIGEALALLDAELATYDAEPEARTFSAGDRVRTTEEGGEDGQGYLGTVYAVSEDGHCDVRFDDGDEGSYLPSELAEAAEAE